MASRKRSITNDADMSAMYKELDEALCPICMDHPHNAVLLICSSHGKGCSSFICDTSYRHSNCLDRFKKLKEDNIDSLSSPSLIQESQRDTAISSDRNLNLTTDITDNHLNISLTAINAEGLVGEPEGSRQSRNRNVSIHVEDQQSTSWERLDIDEINMEKSEDGSNLKCPLCRGTVLGWKVVEEARKYLNLKSRSCSHESCSFLGNYSELRQHARSVHPTVRPADVDPSRQSAWRRLERQREYSDIVSAIRSAMPGAILLGDYVIDNGDGLSGLRGSSGGGGEGSRWLSAFFLFHLIGSMDQGEELRGSRSRMISRYRRATRTFSRRRYLWGENLLGLQDEDDNNDHEEDDEDAELDLNILSDIGDDVPPNRRRRRRLTHAQSDGDQP